MSITEDFESKARAQYDLGPTATFAAKADPRVHYCLYVPPSVGQGEKVDLVVAIHGSSRTSFLEYRDAFQPFGRWNNCVILCPIFSIGVMGDGERHGYKYMQEGDLRYDEVLLGIVDELAAKYRQDWSTFAMFGFSGGAHFAHRFAILHPKRLWAACIGAPGSVTLLDTTRKWWVGIGDLKERFGIEFDREALARLPVQMLVGEQDLETWEITHKPGSGRWMEGANDAGKTRPERLRKLKESFEQAGVKVQFELVPGIAHERLRVLDRVQNFLAGVLAERRRAG